MSAGRQDLWFHKFNVKNVVLLHKTFEVVFHRQQRSWWYHFSSSELFLRAEIMMTSLACLWQRKWMSWHVPLALNWVWERNIWSEDRGINYILMVRGTIGPTSAVVLGLGLETKFCWSRMARSWTLRTEDSGKIEPRPCSRMSYFQFFQGFIFELFLINLISL